MNSNLPALSLPADSSPAKNPTSARPFSLEPLLNGDSTSETVALAILDRQRGLTPILAMESPQISGLLRESATALDATQALTNALLFTAHQFNVVRNMANLQMAILADELLERYWFWRFDEFLYVLKEGVAQTWGKTYDRLDPPTVHEWCRAYAEVRDQLVEHQSQQRAVSFKKAEGTGPAPVLASPEVQALWVQLDRLDNQTLVDGVAYYEALPSPTPEQVRKLAVATELANQRRRAHYWAQVGQQFPAADNAAAAAKEAAYHREKLAWLAAGGSARGAELEAANTRAEVLEDLPQPISPAE